MVHKGMAHDDDEPLLPLMDHDSVRMKEIHQTHHSDILKSTKLSGSTAHDSISSSGPEDPEHPHHHNNHHDHSHGHSHGHAGSLSKRPSNSMESNDEDQMYLAEDHDDDDEPLSLEALKAAAKDKMRLKIAIGLCSTFFCVELAGGLWSESLALLSDSFHLLTDITSFIISMAAIYLSHQPPTATHTFGYHRAEVLGALFSIFLIWGLTLLLVIEACDRVRHPVDVDGKTMSVIAGLGVFVNVLLMFVLGGHHHHHGDDDHEHGHEHGHGHDHAHGHEHGHGHGHGSGSQDHDPLHNEEDNEQDDDLDHDHNGHKAIPQHDHDHHNSGSSTQAHNHHHHHPHSHVNLNMTAATLHVLGDLLSSIGVLISSLVITFFPSMTYLDPICTFIFSILVICTTIGVFKRSVSILMERVPQGINTEEVREAICDIPGVLEVKTLHIWSLTIGQSAMAGTLYLQPEIKDVKRASAIVKRARAMLRTRYRIRESTLQIEMYAPHGRSRATAGTSGPLSSISLHRHAPASSRSSFSGSTATTAMNGRTTAIDTLARHDQDIIFSLEDENDRDYDLDRGSHSSHLHADIDRAGTPLSRYKENRSVLTPNEEDESEDEMEQETIQLHPEQQPHRWA
ncbi:hypothetical protein EMPS_10374 [Entomortierella parvispora]|uniref:Cation efflux protein n=1 Tax=Entomortierella parvispora TaxID=205924 RepID=A0A9P3HJT6_9FUNG|nr:hypothetical protein EMPS_10374 [Entomortierella parvispora]